MKVLFIHAHFDDYEFTAAGLFEVWRRRLGSDFSAKVIVCTDGRAGHHLLSTEATTRTRIAEQEASAQVGKYAFECLRLPNGSIPREACLLVTRDLLAALWKAIRDFEPDYLFCPPLPADALAGVHVDHVCLPLPCVCAHQWQVRQGVDAAVPVIKQGPGSSLFCAFASQFCFVPQCN